MGTIRNVAAAGVGLVFTGIGTWNTLDTLIQPGTPSKQPGPKNPSPRPSNPTPRPNDPTPPAQNPVPDTSPGAPNKQPDRPADRDQTNARARNLRPFAFQSPDMEGRFNLSTRRLLQMERRMQRSHEDLLKRLGEARQLNGERQTNALFDVLQQMLKEHAELQRYLVQSRTAWTGDIEGAEGEDMEPEPEPATDRVADPSRPADDR